MTGKTHKRFASNQVTTRQPAPSQPQTKVCKRCGKGSHPRQLCPARDVTCYRCNRQGHYRSQCLSRTMGEVITPAQQTVLDSQEDNDLYSDTIYLDAINNADDKQWIVTVLVESNSVTYIQSGHRCRSNCIIGENIPIIY